MRERRNPVRRVAGRAFFFKEGRWLDATLTEETEQDPIKIEQYSDAYFKLAARDGGRYAKFLTFEEPVLVRLGGQTYLNLPAGGGRRVERRFDLVGNRR